MSGCTHVCLISKQPMPNLIPLLHEKPERAFFLISDEMKEALYELDSLSDAAGGLLGRAMLCSATRLGPHSRKRAKMLNIKVVDSVDLLNLPEILRTWCSE